MSAPTQELQTLTIHPAREIRGELSVPGDKSLSHRSIILAGLADGESSITGFLPGEDCLCTLGAMQALGAVVEKKSATELIITGTAGKLRPSVEPIDCGNSGTAMRLLAGVLAAQPFPSKLYGDASLSSRPMSRIIKPLQEMGAKISGRGDKETAPLEIEAVPHLSGIHYVMPMASAQVKSAILLAGLFAQGTTTVEEPVPTRDHTEKLLAHFHAPPAIGERTLVDHRTIRVRGGAKLHAHDFHVPGDISSAAFWIVAAAARPGSDLSITHVGLNPTRTGILDVLLRMGAHVREAVTGSQTEAMGVLRIEGTELHGTIIEGELIANVIDELPILSVAAALAQGDTEIRDAQELRVKETDRISAMANNLRAFGVAVTERKDGMTIHGQGGSAKLHGAVVDSFGDHRVAMSCAILGLFSRGVTTIRDVACIATSYPTFREDLQKVVVPEDGGFAGFLRGGLGR